MSWLPFTGFDFAGLVNWLILAPRSWNPPSRSTPFSRFITFWRLCDASWSPPLFPRSLRRSLASCLAALPLPHYRWSRVHGRSSAVSSDESQLCERPSRGGTMPVDWLRGMFPCFDHLPSFSRYEAAFLRVLCFDIAPSLRDEVTLPGRVLSQSSIGTKALPPPSRCLVGTFAMRSPLRVEYFSDLDRNEDSSRTFPRVW